MFEYLDRAIEGFDRDPPGSDFQHGYLECLKTVRAEAPAYPDWVAEAFEAIKEYCDTENDTMLIWQTAKEALERIAATEQVSA